MTTKQYIPELDATLCWPLGKLGIVLTGDAISRLLFLEHDAPDVTPRHPVARRAVDAVRRYLEQPGASPCVPIELQGTAFQKKVWRALRTLGPGEVISYGALAKRLGSGARAVGNACRNNPVPLLVPCHRVVAQNGIGGFSGAQTGPMMAIKTWLLAHEGVEITPSQPH